VAVAFHRMMSDSFALRMAELDMLLEQCREHSPFADSVIRDTSNRSGRDWPWWSVEIERTEVNVQEKRRISAEIRLNSTQEGEPGSFEAIWMARAWEGVSADSFRARGSWPLAWNRPAPADLQATMIALLNTAQGSFVK